MMRILNGIKFYSMYIIPRLDTSIFTRYILTLTGSYILLPFIATYVNQDYRIELMLTVEMRGKYLSYICTELFDFLNLSN